MTANNDIHPRRKNTIISLILWLTALGDEDSAKLVGPLGYDSGAIEKLKADHADVLEEVRMIRLAAPLVGRGMLAGLLRVLLADKLMAVESARDLAALSGAISKLPAWVFGEEEPSKPSKRRTAGSREEVATELRAGLVNPEPVPPEEPGDATPNGPDNALQHARAAASKNAVNTANLRRGNGRRG